MREICTLEEWYNILQAFLLLFFSLSYYLFVITPLSISNLSIRGSTLITPSLTPCGLLFCRNLTTKLFILNNSNLGDIKFFHSLFSKVKQLFLNFSCIAFLYQQLALPVGTHKNHKELYNYN